MKLSHALLPVCLTACEGPPVKEAILPLADTLYIVESGVTVGATEQDAIGNAVDIAATSSGVLAVADSYAGVVLVFDTDGEPLPAIGQRGEGPGEFQIVSALEFYQDSILLTRDVGLARITAFSFPAGEVLSTWRTGPTEIPADQALAVDDDGIVSWTIGFGADLGVVRGRLDGTVIDTIGGFQADVFAACAPPSIDGAGSPIVPFSRRFEWTLAVDGVPIGGCSEGRHLHGVSTEDVVLRVRSDPTPVSQGEREFRRDWLNRRLQGRDPTWSWDGGGIPEHKPFFRAVFRGIGSELWVALNTPGVPSARPTNASPEDPDLYYYMPAVFEVFESDGTPLYLAVGDESIQVRGNAFPARFEGGLWMMVRDPLGLELVRRFELAPSPQ